VTNTPLQALVMMNDPTMLEASRVLAAKLLHEDVQMEDRIRKAFRLIVCRKPNEKEMAVLSTYFEGQLETMNAENANELLNVGEYPRDQNLEPITLAALMQVIST